MRTEKIIYLFLLLFITGKIYAQSEYFHFERITMQDGLPSNRVRSLIEDSEGFMWFATQEGLCRYDGYNFTTFRNDPSNPHSLINNFVLQLFEDHQHNLWISTISGWCVLQNNSETFLRVDDFKKLKGKIPHNIKASHFFEDRKGNIWMSCDYGLYRINSSDTTVTHYVHEPGNVKSLSGNVLASFAQDSTGKIWINARPSVNVFDPDKEEFYHADYNPLQLPIPNGKYLIGITGDEFWFGVWKHGIYKYDPVSKEYLLVGADLPAPSSFTQLAPINFIRDREKHYWASLGYGGICYLDFQQHQFNRIQHNPDDEYSLPTDEVYQVMEDRNGNIWAATGQGVAKMSRKTSRFLPLSYNHFIFQDKNIYDMNAVAQDKNGTIWIGTWMQGLYKIDPSHPEQFKRCMLDPGWENSSMNNYIWDVHVDRQGIVWVGTQSGFARYDQQTQSFKTWYLSQKNDSTTAYYQVARFLEDGSAVFWIASHKGLGKFNPETEEIIWYELPQKHEHGGPFMIRCVAKGADGLLWLGTDGGLYSFDPKTEKFSRFHSDDLGNEWSTFDMIYDVLAMPDSSLFIAAQSHGLIHFIPHKRTFKRYSMVNGLASDNTFKLYPDDYDGLWITTTNGLSRFDMKKKTFTTFDRSDGLMTAAFNSPGSFFRKEDGSVLLCNSAYLVQFDPKQFRDLQVSPSVSLTALRKFGHVFFFDKPLNEIAGIALNYRDRFFSIDFSTLDYANISKTQYAYKLDHFDHDWNYGDKQSSVSYSNLPGGDYILRVKATTGNNFWGPEKVLRIHIEPPFWMTTWFKVIAAIVALALIAAIAQWRIRAIRRKAALSARMHDLQMQALRAQMNPHFIFNCLNSIKAFMMSNEPVKASSYLTKFSSLIRLILENSRDQSVALENEIALLTNYLELESLRSKHKFKFQIDVASGVDAAEVEIPSMLVQPYVENAIWHGLMNKQDGEGMIEIKFSAFDHTIVCTVKDNGVGREQSFSAEKIRKSYGMKITEERLQLLHKKNERQVVVSVTDLKDELQHPSGTLVRIEIPVASGTDIEMI